MKALMAIDPGPTQTAFVTMTYDGKIIEHGKEANECVLWKVQEKTADQQIVIEMIQSFGKPVGQETFETCVWIGRFIEASNGHYRLFRREVTKHLCGSSHSVKDGVVRQRLIDIYGKGVGKSAAIGLKKTPGPLYGFKEDEWQALALGITFGELNLGWKIQ